MKFLKTLTITGLLFTFLTGVFGCSSNSQVSEQKLTSTNKAEETKKAEDIRKVSEQEKSNALAKFNLKEVTVSRVVDGDTIELSDGSKVRFIGVNTPESTTRTEPYGKEASDYTKSQLTGKTVYIEKDVSETDKYGRLLRYIWLDIPKEITDAEIRAKMYNANLLLNGYAEQSTYAPDVKYAEYFKNYAAEARNASKGLWAIDPNGTTKGDTDKETTSSNNASQNSSVSNSTNTSSSSNSSNSSSNNSTPSTQSSSSSGHGQIKGNISSKGEKIYHVPGGAYYDRTNPEAWFNTEEEAQAAGYRKSKR